MLLDTKKNIISNTDITKEYKNCREKAKEMGKVVIFKNNLPDMVLMDIQEYEKTFEMLYSFFDKLEHIEIYETLKGRELSTKKEYTMDDLRKKLKK